MKIAVNTRFLLNGKLEGIGWFTYEIIKRIVLNHPEHEFIFIFDRPYHPKFIFAENVTPIVVPPPARHPILWYLWFEWSVWFVLKKHKPDVFISTDGFLSLKTNIPSIVVVHDLAFEHYPQHLPFKFRFYLRKFTPLFVKKSLHTITVSEFSKKDIIEKYHTAPEKVSVVYNGVNSLYKPLSVEEKIAIKEKYAQGAEYFVFTGAIHPRKNVNQLLKAFEIFKRKQRSNMKLLIIGRYAWNSKDIKQHIENHPFKNDVFHFDYMQVDELCKVIGAAYALALVSLLEGFGIPVVEAMKCNVPVIVSNSTSLPEVAGDAGLLADPNDENDIAHQLITIYKDENLRAKLIANCKIQSQKFDWDNSAVQFYETMINALKNQVT
ncbi:MAG: glycosyltransferase family 4 protein [Chitinophagaceae bacterium]|nr:glycosyltransferase family 4 protein [Chitinophagaceae bacterium]HMN32463.1 glycosyltransferase family 1 protein [Chitinophagaceae bacterium]